MGNKGVYQHQPVQIPDGWTGDKRRFATQVEECLDELYAKLGNLKVKDLGEGIRITLDGKYDIVTGIDIKEKGIDITGEKHITLKSGASMVLESGGELKLNGATIKLDAGAELSVSATGAIRISSGGSFDVDTPNFKISSDDKTMEVGSWKWEQDRLTFDKASSGDKIVFGDDDIHNEKNRLVISPTNRGMTIKPELPEDYVGLPAFLQLYSKVVPGDENTVGTSEMVIAPQGRRGDKCSLGEKGNRWKEAFIRDIYGNTYSGNNCMQYTLLDAPTDAETIAEIGYTPMPDVGPSLDQLQPMAWVDDTTTLRYGLIARGAATYFPGAVRLGEFSGQIDYGYMVPCLIKEIQSLRARVATLEGAT